MRWVPTWGILSYSTEVHRCVLHEQNMCMRGEGALHLVVFAS